MNILTDRWRNLTGKPIFPQFLDIMLPFFVSTHIKPKALEINLKSVTTYISVWHWLLPVASEHSIAHELEIKSLASGITN